MARIWIGLALVAALAVAARAEPPARRTFAIEIAGDWRAEALRAALAADLADDRLALATGAPDLVVHLELDAAALRYAIDARWPGAPPTVRGGIALGTLDRARLAGVLRDQLHRLARATGEVGPAAGAALPGLGAVGLALAALALALALVFGGAARRLGWARVRALPALGHAARVVGAVGAVALAIAAAGDRLGNPSGIALAAAGLAWGAFVTVTVPVVLPPLPGFDRIESHELPRVIAAWLALVAVRLVAAAALYAPVAVVTWLCTDQPVLAVPIALLAVRLVVRAIVAVAALAVDDAWIDREADARGWDAAVRGYLVGYLRRNGLPVDEPLLARIELHPGAGDELAVYGGGLARSRIVIPRRWLELALAPWGRPHDYAAPRVSTLHWTQWNAGLVIATPPDAPVPTRDARQPRELTELGEHERELVGEPPTLAGIVEPFALDPRSSYRPHDDPMWLDWESGEEYDGTDAGDRDFLFGALALALGTIQRHGERWATIALALGRTRLPRLRAWLARVPAIAGDDHAALAGARHHLVQYLAWRLDHTRSDDLLTARAYAPELEAASRRAVASAAAHPGDRALRRRIARLGGAPRTPTRWRRLAVAGAIAAAAGVATVSIVGAVRYHATYVQRMEHKHGQR
ncbi:MAG TPA: hypothetical protein VLX92_20180 [Kofleriaceae bacterium]|nr:hypothetical protein [Kofleriaceae bacterium]